MSIEFSITRKKIITSQDVNTIAILLSNNKSIKLLNVIFVLEYKSNLISLSQLQNTSFIYYDKSIRMILMRREKIIAYAKHNWNLFILNLIKLRKAMTISCGRSTYIVSKKKQI